MPSRINNAEPPLRAHTSTAANSLRSGKQNGLAVSKVWPNVRKDPAAAAENEQYAATSEN